MFGQSVEITHRMEVPAKAVKVSSTSGEVEINPPSVHIGYKPIPLLLISYRWRGAQVRMYVCIDRHDVAWSCYWLIIDYFEWCKSYPLISVAIQPRY